MGNGAEPTMFWYPFPNIIKICYYSALQNNTDILGLVASLMAPLWCISCIVSIQWGHGPIHGHPWQHDQQCTHLCGHQGNWHKYPPNLQADPHSPTLLSLSVPCDYSSPLLLTTHLWATLWPLSVMLSTLWLVIWCPDIMHVRGLFLFVMQFLYSHHLVHPDAPTIPSSQPFTEQELSALHFSEAQFLLVSFVFFAFCVSILMLVLQYERLLVRQRRNQKISVVEIENTLSRALWKVSYCFSKNSINLLIEPIAQKLY